MDEIHHPTSPPRDPSADDGTASLLAYARTGDPDQLERVVRLHGAFVFAVCRRVLQHQCDAEDAVQATFVACMRHARQFQPRMALRSWLGAIALNAARHALRSQRRRRAHEMRAAPHDMVVSGPELDDDSESVRRVLGRLDAQTRLMLWLRFGEGLTVREIADLSHLPQGTVESRMRRALEHLRRLLSPRVLSPSLLGSACDLREQPFELSSLLRRLVAEGARIEPYPLRRCVIAALTAVLLLVPIAQLLHATTGPPEVPAAAATRGAPAPAVRPSTTRAPAAGGIALCGTAICGTGMPLQRNPRMAGMPPSAVKPIQILEYDLHGVAAAMLALGIDVHAGIHVIMPSRNRALHGFLRAADHSSNAVSMSANELREQGAEADLLEAFRNGSLQCSACSRSGGDTTATVARLPEALAAETDMRMALGPSCRYLIFAVAPLADPGAREVDADGHDSFPDSPHADIPQDSIVLFGGDDASLLDVVQRAQPTHAVYPVSFDDALVVPLVIPQPNRIGCPPGDFGVRIIHIGDQWGDGTGRPPPHAHG